MSVYMKLIKVRNEIRKKELKKTGKSNNHKYYELGDFLPAITELCEQEKLCTFVNFTDDLATLSVIDAEKPDTTIEFTSPMSEASLRNCHAVQNLGATQTYLRRYLYMNAFEIIESDVLDAGVGDETKAPVKSELSEKQLKRLFAIATSNNYSDADITNIIKKKYGIESKKDLSKAQYDELCKGIEANPKPSN